MRKITAEACEAFKYDKFFSNSNTIVMNNALYLHGHKIAEWRRVGSLSQLWVTLAGWNTNTTRERLNGIEGVSVRTKQGQAFLNGKKWGGEWVSVSEWGTI